MAALAIHACVAVGLLALQPRGLGPAAPEPIQVQWIDPEPIVPPKPMPVAPKVQPQIKPGPKASAPKVVQPSPPPLVAAAETAPEPQAPAATPPEIPEVQAIAPPATTSGPAPKAVATPTLPISPPSFNADYLHNPAPAYPAIARRNGESGRVVLRVLVTPVGTAERVELRTSSGWRRLDSAALETVQRWKFVPARQGDTPVPAWVLIPILFTLEG